VRLLSASQKMKTVAIGRHQAFEQRLVHAMEVLQRIDQSELRPQVQLQSCVANGSEIHQHHTAVCLLQGDGGVDGSGGGAGSAFAFRT